MKKNERRVERGKREESDPATVFVGGGGGDFNIFSTMGFEFQYLMLLSVFYFFLPLTIKLLEGDFTNQACTWYVNRYLTNVVSPTDWDRVYLNFKFDLFSFLVFTKRNG